MAEAAFDQFGQIAVRNGLISEKQLTKALERQADQPQRAVGQLLLDLGAISSPRIELVLQLQRELRDDEDKDPLTIAQDVGQQILKEKMATREQVVQALKEIKGRIDAGKSAPELAWLMAKRGFITQDQARQILYPDGGGLPQIDGYKIHTEIKSGGVGTVFKGRQLSMNRIVAIKVLASKLTGADTHVQRFYEEARAQARLNHQNTVSAIEIGQCNGLHYFVMEYVNGESVLEILQRQGPLKVKRGLGITYEVARALEHAHSHRIIHRDIKPSNILINHRNEAKLCDLGFASIDGVDTVPRVPGTTLGTPHYMSPEQARGALDLDERTDIYSLGASLYQMLTGRLPFPGRSAKEIMRSHITDPLEFEAGEERRFGTHVCDLIRRMMAKSLEDRFQRARDVMDSIAPYLDHTITGTDFADRLETRRIVSPRLYKPRAVVLHAADLDARGERLLDAFIEALGAEKIEVTASPYGEVEYQQLEAASAVIIGETLDGPSADLRRLLEDYGSTLIGKIGAAILLGDPFDDRAKLLLSKVLNGLLTQGMWIRGGLRRAIDEIDQSQGEAAQLAFEQALIDMARSTAQRIRGLPGALSAG